MGCGMRHTNDSIFASTNAQLPMFISVEGRSTYCNGSKNLKAWSVIYVTPSSTMSFSQVNPGSLPFHTPNLFNDVACRFHLARNQKDTILHGIVENDIRPHAIYRYFVF